MLMVGSVVAAAPVKRDAFTNERLFIKEYQVVSIKYQDKNCDLEISTYKNIVTENLCWQCGKAKILILIT